MILWPIIIDVTHLGKVRQVSVGSTVNLLGCRMQAGPETAWDLDLVT